MSERTTIGELLAHATFLQSLALSLTRDPSTAEDMVQDTWLAALRQPPRRGAPKGWLSAVLRHGLYRRRRVQGRIQSREARAARAEATDSTADLVARDAMLEDVTRAVLSLGEAQRQVVMMRFYEGLPPREIARRLDAPVSTVKTRLQRALEQLRVRLDARYGDRETWSLSLLALAGFESPAPVAAPFVPKGASWIVGKMGWVGVTSLLLLGWVMWWLADHDLDFDRWRARESASRPVDLDSQSAEPSRGDAESMGVTATRKDEPSTSHATRPVILSAEWDDGRPVRDALLVPALDGRPLTSLWTDVDGQAIWEHSEEIPLDDTALYAVVHGTPRRGQTVWEDGSLRLVLPRQKSIEGVVSVEGGLPPEPIRLTLESALGLAVRDDFPPQVWTELKDAIAVGTEIPVETDANGRFALPPIFPDDWFGTMGVDPRFVIVDPWNTGPGQRSIRLEAPTQDLVLHLKSASYIQGTVVTSSGDPAPDALVKLLLADGRGRGRGSVSVDVDRSGRFLWRIRQDDVHSVTASCSSREAGSRTSTQMTFDEPPLVWDFGRISLPPSRSLTLEIRDEAGVPIQGAVAQEERRAGPPSPPSDLRGRTTIETLPLGAERVLVAGFGYRTAVAAVPSGDAVLPVVLSRQASLSVHLTDRAGRPAVGAEVLLHASRERPSDSGSGLEVESAAGSTHAHFVAWDDGRSGFRADESGVVWISPISPDEPLKLQVFGEGELLVEEELPGLERGEHRQVDLQLPRVRRSLLGRVLDTRGRPIIGASVAVAAEASLDQGGFSHAETDAQGSFVLEDLYVDEVDLRISRAGFRTMHLQKVSPSGELIIELERGASVVLDIVDPSGQPLEGVQVRNDASPARELSRVGVSSFQLVDLGPDPVGISVFVGGQHYSRVIEPASGERDRIVLPDHGAVTVSWDPAELPGDDWVLLLQPSEPDWDKVRKRLSEEELLAGEFRFPAIRSGRWNVWIGQPANEAAALGPRECDVSAKEVSRVRF